MRTLQYRTRMIGVADEINAEMPAFWVQKLQDALPEKYGKLAASFHPSGKGDFRVRIWRGQGEKCSKHILTRFHDAAVRFDEFPYPLENVSGFLSIKGAS